MAHFGLRLGCWQRDCSATNGGPPELDHSNKGTGSSIRVDALWCEAWRPKSEAETGNSGNSGNSLKEFLYWQPLGGSIFVLRPIARVIPDDFGNARSLLAAQLMWAQQERKFVITNVY